MTTKLPIIPACIHAGDVDDEFCKECVGITMKLDESDEIVSCTNCGGYEAPAEDVTAQEPKVETVAAATEIAKPRPEPKKEPKKQAKAKKVEKIQEEPVETVITAEQAPSNPICDHAAPSSQVVSTPTNVFVPLSTTTEIRAESSASIEIKDKSGRSRWYKVAFTETRTVFPGANLNEERIALFDAVNFTLDEQISQIEQM